jgi:hypothetical protein
MWLCHHDRKRKCKVKIGMCDEKVVQGHAEIKVWRGGGKMEYVKRGRKGKSNK